MVKTEEALLEYCLNWDKAIVQNDVEEISRYMSDDWVCVATDGGISSKEHFLNWIKSGDLIHTRMDTDESRIKVYGNTGIVTGKGTSGGTYKGEPFSFYEWSTSVFTWENSQWVCVLTMLTPAKL